MVIKQYFNLTFRRLVRFHNHSIFFNEGLLLIELHSVITKLLSSNEKHSCVIFMHINNAALNALALMGLNLIPTISIMYLYSLVLPY